MIDLFYVLIEQTCHFLALKYFFYFFQTFLIGIVRSEDQELLRQSPPNFFRWQVGAERHHRPEDEAWHYLPGSEIELHFFHFFLVFGFKTMTALRF